MTERDGNALFDRLLALAQPARKRLRVLAVCFGLAALAVLLSTLYRHELPMRALGTSILSLQFAFTGDEMLWQLARLGDDGRAILRDALRFDLLLILSYGVALPLGVLSAALGCRGHARRFGAGLALACCAAPLLDLLENTGIAAALWSMPEAAGLFAAATGVCATLKFALLSAGIGYCVWSALRQGAPARRIQTWVRARRVGTFTHPVPLACGLAIGVGLITLPWLSGGQGLGITLIVLCGGFVPLGLAWHPRWEIEARDAALEPETPPARVVVEPTVPLVSIPAGKFRLGSPESETGRFLNERCTKGVVMAEFEMTRMLITRGDWRRVMPKSSWPTEWSSARDDDALPANFIDWGSALRFCNALSDREGLGRAYPDLKDEDSVSTPVRWDRDADGYRLPTEAEWEYAARGGTTTPYPWAGGESKLSEHAWWRKNADGPRPVGTKPANGFGLHDMIGNVFEWCWDGWNDQGADPRARDESTAGSRVVRGGSFVYDDPRVLRSACRGRGRPSGQDSDLGFRCVRAPRRQHGSTH
ncbi:MAG: formylglycine-generating enzyme family protein [Planctomycetota bacterium]